MNKVKDKLPALVDEELAAAMEEHPLFASAHEGYAVLLEEVEETENEMKCVRFDLNELWVCTRNDRMPSVKTMADVIVKHAIDLAAEAIQVAAMAKKIVASLSGKVSQ